MSCFILSFIDVSPLSPLIWAHPVSPGLTWCLTMYRGISSLNCSTNCGLSGLGPTMDISPFSILKSCGSSSMLVRLSTLPTFVTLGSSLTVHFFFSSLSFCISMVRNLYIMNDLLCKPTLSCLYITGPGEDSLMAMRAISMMGENTTISMTDPTISMALFMNLFSALVRGTFLILMTGIPSASSIMGLDGMTRL